MRVVLYSDEDLEPITVIELPSRAIARLKSLEHIVVAVPEPFVGFRPAEDPLTFSPIKTVRIWAERFIRKGQEHVFLFTRDEALAMKLRAELLPGQRSEYGAESFSAGFRAGLLAALA